jgi:hypothetical protein
MKKKVAKMCISHEMHKGKGEKAREEKIHKNPIKLVNIFALYDINHISSFCSHLYNFLFRIKMEKFIALELSIQEQFLPHVSHAVFRHGDEY